MKLDLNWRKMLIEALPAMSATTAALYTYRKKGSIPLAALGALGGYGLFLMGRKVVRWVLEGTPVLPTKTAELPKVESATPAMSPTSPAVTSPLGVQPMTGLAVGPDGRPLEAQVSVLDDNADGSPRGGQVLPFANGGRR